MNCEKLKEELSTSFPDHVIDDGFGMPQLHLNKTDLIESCKILIDCSRFDFNMLVCETAVDRKDNFEMIYHLRSISTGDEIIVKVAIEREDLPVMPSVYCFWSAAELFEDEIFDLFGIKIRKSPQS